MGCLIGDDLSLEPERHTSYALHDALVAAQRLAVEVHISDINAREPWRRVSVTAPATRHQTIGRG